MVIGHRLGPYEVLAKLGEGGMGEVYRARDTRLDRTVAVKILPSEFAADPQFRARFEREAKAIAALSHPHICTLHDVGRDGGTEYLVMEFLDGQSLGNRLQQLRGPLPIDQVLMLGAQIADALDKAHRAGIVHRDLKPANIMLTKAGAKLLDFGLAKLQAPAAPFGMSTMQETKAASPDTAAGTILGTIHYMSPEQVEGREADKRSDIWALGAVLYEMATGRRPFDGTSPASVIGAILKDDPAPISKSQPLTPSALDHLVERCLAKDPDERWQDAGDLKRQLAWIARAGVMAGDASRVSAPSRGMSRWVGVAGLIAGAALGLAGLLWPRAPTASPDRIVVSIAPPDGVRFGGSFAISPDGRHFAFVGQGSEGPPMLWVRSLDSPGAQQLAGTEGAAFPFWSPQGDAIGFFASGKLKTTTLVGGTTRTLSTALNGRGGTWGEDGSILFVPESNGPVYRIPDKGGELVPVTTVRRADRQLGHRWPVFVDRTHFIYTAQGSGEGVGVFFASLDSQDTVRLVNHYSNSAVVNQHLVFVSDGMLVARPIDLERRQVAGNELELAGPVSYVSGLGFGVWSVSEHGGLTFAPGTGATATAVFQWFDRQGKSLGPIARDTDLSQHNSYNPRIFRNGRTISFATFRAATADVWLIDNARDVASRFTFDDASDLNPVPSPDGTRVLFGSNRDGAFNLYSKSVTGSSEEARLSTSKLSQYPSDWASDGETMVFTMVNEQRQSDIMMLSTRTGSEPKPVLASSFNEFNGRVSPDGRWIAYNSDESGRLEVYVQRFPDGGERSQISTFGGTEPQWRDDGRELFYLAPNRTLTAVAVTTTPTFSAGRPTTLFDTVVDTTLGSIQSWHYAPAPDGRRFLLSVSNAKPAPVTIMLNWASGLGR